MDNELFGEMHEQEENGLYGKRHERELLGLSNVGDMCQSHKPNLKDSYVQWHDWAESQAKKGIKQIQCEKCKRWFFPSEL